MSSNIWNAINGYCSSSIVISTIASDEDCICYTDFWSNETNTSNNMTGATFLFIQGAQSGSLSEVNATTSTLQLGNVSDKTILFSDRSNRIVESIDTADFIGNWSTGAKSFAADPPNVALVVHDDVEQSQDLAVIELFNPVYDSEANTLRYDIVSENGTSIAGLPGEFGQSSLVIDSSRFDPFSGSSDCCDIHNNTPWKIHITVSKPTNHN
jgi:hypothetical protein